MTTWYSLKFADGVAAFAPTKAIQEAWLATVLATAKVGRGQDYSSAVFSRMEIGTGELTVYFTPSARAVAQSFGAASCDKPSEEGIELLVGDQRAWEIHFPGYIERFRTRYSA